MFKLAAFALCAALFAGSAIAGETIELPRPQKSGGADVLTAIDRRASEPATGFPTTSLSREDLSTILWAATGQNRDGKLWTVPMALGRPPYCKIYVVARDGGYLYDWEEHALQRVSRDDLTGTIPIQPFAKDAPVTLVIVADGREVSQMSGPYAQEFPVVLAGAMSQNIYLAAQAVDVGARLIYSIKRDEAQKSLRLDRSDKPLFGIALGKK